MGWGPFSLASRRAVVTGGAMGIGFGIVERFLEAGADVLIADLDGEAAKAAASKLVGVGGLVDAIAIDVSRPDAGERMLEEMNDRFGGADILVNNAGIYPMKPALEMTPEFLDRVYEVNLRGTILAATAFGRYFADHDGGVIVNIASIDAIHPSMVGLAAYDASKGGVLMFTKNFALEMAPKGVRVNAIAPGGIQTEGTSHPLSESGMTPEEMEALTRAFTARIPLARMGTPDDIATVAVFLASPASAYMTGELIVVDGGALLM